MNVFEVVKENVTARQAAEAYGLKVGRTGMACCPFHSDKSPSMKLDERKRPIRGCIEISGCCM